MSTFPIEEEIKLSSWNDIIDRPKYKSPVRPKKHHYLRISASYSLKDEEALCGVSDCLKPHKQGYLVETSNDEETSLCEACGERFFHVNFKKMQSVLQSHSKIRKQKIHLNQVLEEDVTRNRINALKKSSKGANWLYKVLSSFCDTYPIELIKALNELAKDNSDNSIMTQLMENNADSTQIENVEKIQGLSIFASDIREELIGKILKPLMELQNLTEDPSDSLSLTRYCTWADGLDEQFAHVEALIAEGQLFFTNWNLERLKSIPLAKDSARRVRTLSWTSEKAAKGG